MRPRGSSGHGEHSLAALVGFVEQRGQLQQELEGTVHVLSEILANTKPGTQLTMLLAQAHPPCPIREGSWDRDHFPVQARHSTTVTRTGPTDGPPDSPCPLGDTS